MGFLTFPREWEGQHEAFPAYPAQFDGRGPLSPEGIAVLFGAIGGVAWNLSQAMRRRPLTLAVLNGIGLCTIPFTVLDIASHEWARRQCRADIEAILKADNKTMPPRKFIKFTKENTPETNSVICGILAVGGLLAYSRAPNGPKAGILTSLGAFGSGAYFGSQMSGNWHKRKNGALLMKYQISCLKGSQIYSERTGKPADVWLYGSQIGSRQGMMRGQEGSPWSFFESGSQDPEDSEAVIMVDEDNVLNSGSPVAAFPLPPGAEPHMVVQTQDGTKIFAPQRDYDWNPDSAELGLESLHDHLEELTKARSKLAQMAEYLWSLVARREAEKFKPYGRDEEAEEVVLEKKALELLTSIHKQVYTQVAELDWCIANTKKLVLQFQSDGKWLPASSAQSTFSSETKERILNNIRGHKKNLEVQQATFANDENLQMMQIPDDEKEDVRRALKENLAATTKLLEDLERDAEQRK